jgi:hypothetical protein
MTNRITRAYSWIGIALVVLVVLHGAFLAIIMAGDPDAHIGYILGATGLFAFIVWGLWRVFGWFFAGFYACFWQEPSGGRSHSRTRDIHASRPGGGEAASKR